MERNGAGARAKGGLRPTRVRGETVLSAACLAEILRRMKLGVVFLSLLVAAPAWAQGGSNRVIDRGGGADVGIRPSDVKPQVTTSAVVKLGAARTWKSADGREMTAELVSWPLSAEAAAEKDPAKAKFDIVRNGQVRLRRDKTTFTLALDKLSPADKAYVGETAAKVKKAQAAPAKP